jgi:hypothetical protein
MENRNLFVSLDYPGDAMPPEFEGLLGDQIIQSSSDLAKKANPVVVEMMMRR